MDLTAKSLSDQTVFLGSLQTGPPTGPLVNNLATVRCSPDDQPPRDWASFCSITGWHSEEAITLDPADSELVDSLQKTSQNMIVRYEGSTPSSGDFKEVHKPHTGVNIGSLQVRDKLADLTAHVPALLTAVIPAQTTYELKVEFKESFKHLLQTPTAVKYLSRGFQLQLNTKMKESSWSSLKSRMSRTPAGQLLRPLLAQVFPVKNSRVQLMVRPTRLPLAMSSIGVSDSALLELLKQSVLHLLQHSYASAGLILTSQLAQAVAAARFSGVTILLKVGGGYQLVKFRGHSLHYLFEELSKTSAPVWQPLSAVTEPAGQPPLTPPLCDFPTSEYLRRWGRRRSPGSCRS